MNKQQKLKLARKYFIQQKLEEIGKFLLIAISILAGTGFLCTIAYALGYLGCNIIVIDSSCIALEDYLLRGTVFILILFILGFLFPLLIGGIYDWLNSNWQRAKRRAGL